MGAGALGFTAAAVVCTPFAALLLWNYLVPIVLRLFSLTVGSAGGWYLRKKTEGRRALICQLTELLEEESRANAKPRGQTADDGSRDGNWDGIVGFFHPFCNAGGGGERVEETEDGRVIFGVLGIGWRSEMGNKGFLSTGKLGARVAR